MAHSAVQKISADSKQRYQVDISHTGCSVTSGGKKCCDCATCCWNGSGKWDAADKSLWEAFEAPEIFCIWPDLSGEKALAMPWKCGSLQGCRPAVYRNIWNKLPGAPRPLRQNLTGALTGALKKLRRAPSSEIQRPSRNLCFRTCHLPENVSGASGDAQNALILPRPCLQ